MFHAFGTLLRSKNIADRWVSCVLDKFVLLEKMSFVIRYSTAFFEYRLLNTNYAIFNQIFCFQLFFDNTDRLEKVKFGRQTFHFQKWQPLPFSDCIRPCYATLALGVRFYFQMHSSRTVSENRLRGS